MYHKRGHKNLNHDCWYPYKYILTFSLEKERERARESKIDNFVYAMTLNFIAKYAVSI